MDELIVWLFKNAVQFLCFLPVIVAISCLTVMAIHGMGRIRCMGCDELIRYKADVCPFCQCWVARGEPSPPPASESKPKKPGPTKEERQAREIAGREDAFRQAQARGEIPRGVRRDDAEDMRKGE